MDGYSYQSVCVVTDCDGAPVFALPDIESAAVMAATVGDGTNIACIPVVQLPWYPVQQQAVDGTEEVTGDGER